jgi:hypothetical protein
MGQRVGCGGCHATSQGDDAIRICHADISYQSPVQLNDDSEVAQKPDSRRIGGLPVYLMNSGLAAR